uniref:Salivary allergen 2 n=1 Tax=Ctenocephalides felis TaxID=7515 RepID=Q9NH66_CTEFE|nr:salivary allergen 2 [Ctenocephalides felis]
MNSLLSSIIIVVFSVWLSVIFAVNVKPKPNQDDYCNLNCTNGPNVGCTKPDVPRDCQNFKLVNITERMKKAFLNAHNRKRRLVAAGKGLLKDGVHTPIAAKMPNLTWNIALAKLAEYNVKQCEMKHDCAKTRHGHTGQNLFFYGTTLSPIKNSTIAKMAVDGWYAESKDTRLEDIKKLTTIYPNGKPIGHYTQLIWGNTTKVGCAVSTYKKHSNGNMFNMTLVACNYRGGNMLEEAVYQIKDAKNPKSKNQTKNNKKPKQKMPK